MHMVGKFVRPLEQVEKKSAHFPSLDVVVPVERRLVTCGVEHPLAALAEPVSVGDPGQGACFKTVVIARVGK